MSVSEPDDLAPPSLSFDDAYEPELAFDDDESSSLEDELNDQEEDALIVSPAVVRASPPRNYTQPNLADTFSYVEKRGGEVALLSRKFQQPSAYEPDTPAGKKLAEWLPSRTACAVAQRWKSLKERRPGERASHPGLVVLGRRPAYSMCRQQLYDAEEKTRK